MWNSKKNGVFFTCPCPLVLACVALLAFATVSVNALQPVVDVPYPEIVSTRFAVSGTGAPVSWPVLPLAVPVQAVAGSQGGVAGAFILAQDTPDGNTLYFAYDSSSPTQGDSFTFAKVKVMLSKMVPPITASCRLATAGVGSPLTAIACPQFLMRVNCTGTPPYSVSCGVTVALPVDFGTVHDAIVVPATNGVYVGAAQGLFYQPPGVDVLTVAGVEETTVVAAGPLGQVIFFF